ncbi:MAG: hypothetical protein OXG44_12675 [Gammaproteobacteria bacterium]|nr:hypothetical protein [Gammaproteobacteria bacterium]
MDHQIVIDPYQILSLTAIRLHPDQDVEDAGGKDFYSIIDDYPTLGDADTYERFLRRLEDWMNEHHWPHPQNPDGCPWGFSHDVEAQDVNGISLWYVNDRDGERGQDRMVIQVITLGTWFIYGADYDFEVHVMEHIEQQAIEKRFRGVPTHYEWCQRDVGLHGS